MCPMASVGELVRSHDRGCGKQGLPGAWDDLRHPSGDLNSRMILVGRLANSRKMLGDFPKSRKNICHFRGMNAKSCVSLKNAKGQIWCLRGVQNGRVPVPHD